MITNSAMHFIILVLLLSNVSSLPILLTKPQPIQIANMKFQLQNTLNSSSWIKGQHCKLLLDINNTCFGPDHIGLSCQLPFCSYLKQQQQAKTSIMGIKKAKLASVKIKASKKQNWELTFHIAEQMTANVLNDGQLGIFSVINFLLIENENIYLYSNNNSLVLHSQIVSTMQHPIPFCNEFEELEQGIASNIQVVNGSEIIYLFRHETLMFLSIEQTEFSIPAKAHKMLSDSIRLTSQCHLYNRELRCLGTIELEKFNAVNILLRGGISIPFRLLVKSCSENSCQLFLGISEGNFIILGTITFQLFAVHFTSQQIQLLRLNNNWNTASKFDTKYGFFYGAYLILRQLLFYFFYVLFFLSICGLAVTCIARASDIVQESRTFIQKLKKKLRKKNIVTHEEDHFFIGIKGEQIQEQE